MERIAELPSRRKFMGHLVKGAGVIALMGAGSMAMEGCNLEAEIADWAPVGLSVFNSAVTLLQSAGLISPPLAALAGVITAAFNQVLSDAKQYEAIQPPPAGVKAKLLAGLQIIVTNFQSFLSSLNLPTTGNLETLVVGFAQIILDAISGFVNQLGPTTVVTMAKQLRVGHQVVTPKPVLYRTTGAFKRTWNRTAKAYGYPQLVQPLHGWEHVF